MIKLNLKSAFLFTVIFGLTVLLQGCGTVYYIGETTEAAPIYASDDITSTVLYTAPIGAKILIKKRNKKQYYIVYEGYLGYLYAPVFSNYHRFNSIIDGDLYGYSTVKIKPPTFSSNYYSSPSPRSSSGGTVNVKGYYRKSGTYVSPHTRSSPRRR